METSLTGKVAKAAGSASAARRLGGLETWISTNTSRGTSGAGAGGGAAPTDGTQRAFTEAMLKTVIQSCYTQGGDPDVIMVGPYNKGVVSGFTGRTQARQMIAEDKIQAAASLFSSDFGELKIVPSRFSRDRTVSILQKDMWAVAYLRPFKMEKLARTGDAEKRLMLVEYTLEARNEAASAKVADLTTSLI